MSLATTRKPNKPTRRRKSNYLRNSITKVHWLWLLGGALGGALILHGALLHFNANKKLSSPAKAQTPAIADKGTTIERLDHPKQPTFDFYTILSTPNNESDVVDFNRNTTTSLSSVPSAPTVTKSNSEHNYYQQNTAVSANNTTSTPQSMQYIVQVGSFKDQADAEELRAQLTLENFEAQVEPARLGGNTIWYRVIIGPFALKQQAIKQQQLLAKINYSPLVLKRDEQPVR